MGSHAGLLLLLGLLLRAPAPAQQVQAPLRITCTPDSIHPAGGQRVPSRNPIAAALERAGPGTVVELMAGDYPPFSVGFQKANEWNARTAGGSAASPITVRAAGRVRIVAGGGSEAITIGQERKNGFITFEGLEIVPGYRAGIFFFRLGPGQVHEGFRFLDCSIVGGYDHARAAGAPSKWGVWGHSLKDFEFRGLRGRVRVVDIQQEHGFYLQNPKGDITLENVDGARLGRTFLQLTARSADGEPGVGRIRVRNCRVEDVCLAAGDNYKGGSAFTLGGRLQGPVSFEGNTYRAGFDARLRALTNRGRPYGTGAFVAWASGGEMNGTLVLRDNVFEMAPGCGDRPVVSIGGCREVRLEGANRFVAGAHASALELDPVHEDGSPANPANVRVRVAPSSVFKGQVRKAGKSLSAAELAALSSS